MNQEWYKNPTYLMIGGAALFVAFILLRNQNNTTSTSSSQGQPIDANMSITPSSSAPLGTYSTYLDGSGVAHQLAVGPYYYYNASGGVVSGPSQLTPSVPINNSLV